jgi:hypothetical protein
MVGALYAVNIFTTAALCSSFLRRWSFTPVRRSFGISLGDDETNIKYQIPRHSREEEEEERRGEEEGG